MPMIRCQLPLLLLLLLGFGAAVPLEARAQSCWTTGAISLDFGTIAATSNTDARTALVLTCQASTNIIDVLTLHVTACLFIGEGTPPGIAPRRMGNNNGDFMNYDLYADAARTQLIGPFGGTYPVYALSFDVPARQTGQYTFPIYGRVPAGQRLPASFPFQGLPAGSIVRYSYNNLLTPSASDCANGSAGFLGGTGQASFSWTGVFARFPDACVITTATDIDFGVVPDLSTPRTQNASIQLRCPTGTAWQVTLDDGANATGTTRRMAAGARRIRYELFQDAPLQTRWGNTPASGVSGTGNNTLQSLTVYGQVPVQADALPGSYSDTITVTLTY